MAKRSASTLPRTTKRTHRDAAAEYAGGVVETWTAIGLFAATMGIVAAAARAYELVLLHRPASVEALVGWLRLLRAADQQNGDHAGTLRAIARLVAAAEQHADAVRLAAFFRELTECHLQLGLNEQAGVYVQQAVALEPRDAGLQLLLAQTLIRLGARAAAAAALKVLLLLLPLLLAEFSKSDIETARSAHAELAAIAAADGNIDLSISELTATLLLPPPPANRTDEYTALWCAFATAKERANRIPEALEACERAEAAVGPLPRILITHGYLLLLSETRLHAEKAVKLLARVVEAEPPEWRARDAQEKSGEDLPGDFLPWYLLGKAYTVLEAPRAAYDAYQIALRRALTLPTTWLAVGKLYLELKQLPDALAAYSQALRLQPHENLPGTAAAWDGLACVYERCDEQLADATDACLRAAMCFRAVGDVENAEYYEDRLARLLAAAQKKGPVPELGQPLGVPSYFLRDLVTLLPSERIAFVQGQGHAPAQLQAQPQPQPQQPPQQPPSQAQTPNGPGAPGAPAPAPPVQGAPPGMLHPNVPLHHLGQGSPTPRAQAPYGFHGSPMPPDLKLLPPPVPWREPHLYQPPPGFNGMMTPPPGAQHSPLPPPQNYPPPYFYGQYAPPGGVVMPYGWRQ